MSRPGSAKLRFLGLLFGLGPLAACAEPAPMAPGGPPSFLVIVTDDLGWADPGYAGSVFHRTPHIDGLAREGLVFDQAYAASAVCSPSRASLLTGRHPVRHGITVALGPSVVDTGAPVGSILPGNPERRLWGPVVRDHLPTSETTLAECLRDAGYRTGFIGKWHLGRVLPGEHGFDTVVGADRFGVAQSYFSPYGLEGLADGPPGEHLTERITGEAIEFLRGVEQAPFLLFLSCFAPHAPWQAKAELTRAYEARAAELAPPPDGQSNPTYAAMLHTLDENVGRLLAALEELALAERTLVVFTSDNGAITDRVLFRHNEKKRQKVHITSNAPLRAGKGTLYEGGLRVPLVFRGPMVAPGTSHVPTVGMDLYPTLLSLADLEPGATDGVDLSPLLQGEAFTPAREALRFHMPHQTMACAERRGSYKLVHYFSGRTELYDLSRDVGESNDLAAVEPERTERMRDELLTWLRENGAHFPAPNPDFRPREE